MSWLAAEQARFRAAIERDDTPPREGANCGWCGERFIPVEANQRYCCADHSRRARAHQNREHMRAKRADARAQRLAAALGET